MVLKLGQFGQQIGNP